MLKLYDICFTSVVFSQSILNKPDAFSDINNNAQNGTDPQKSEQKSDILWVSSIYFALY